MQPGQRAFDDPPGEAEPAAVRRAALGEHGGDALRAERRDAIANRSPGRLAAVGACVDGRPGVPGSAGIARTSGRSCVMSLTFAAVTCAARGTPRASMRMWCFDALLTAIGWVRSSFFPPRNARSDALSTTARADRGAHADATRRGIRPCSRRHTPARCHCTRRRQQVLPDPQPISLGNICHGMPLRRTNRMPGQRSAIGHPRPPHVLPPASRRLREERFDPAPQGIVDQTLGHA